MFIGIFMFLILIAMGGLIAFLGDRIGSKVGKKRMTLFGLRPKYTSVIVTIISGILISFFTIAVLAVVNEMFVSPSSVSPSCRTRCRI